MAVEISARHDNIAKVLCSCCEEQHYVNIKLNKLADPKDPADYIAYLEFKSPDDFCLKERIRRGIQILKNKDNYTFDNVVDSILLNWNQVKEVYQLLRANFNIYFQPSQDEIQQIENTKPDLKIQDDGDGWKILSIYRDEGLVFYLDFFEPDDSPTAYLREFGLGWFYNKNEEPDVRRYVRRWIFESRKLGVVENEILLIREQVISFLASLHYIVTNTVINEKGMPQLKI